MPFDLAVLVPVVKKPLPTWHFPGSGHAGHQSQQTHRDADDKRDAKVGHRAARTATGILWFVAAAALFAIGMYGVAEILANRVPKQEEYIARVPAIAIVPWFLAGSLFPISAMPAVLTWIAKFLPLTHGLALMRYGLLQDSSGLHNIWGMSNATAMGSLSLAVMVVFALALSAVSIRVFTRAALR